jgi:hypothetical protein
MGEDVRGDEGLLGPANATVLTEIMPYVSEYRLFYLSHLTHLSLSLYRSSESKREEAVTAQRQGFTEERNENLVLLLRLLGCCCVLCFGA